MPMAVRPLVSGSYICDEGGVFEFAGGHGADDVGEGEVSGAFLEVERGEEAVVALFCVGRLGELGQPGIICRRAALRHRRGLDLETGRQQIDDQCLDRLRRADPRPFDHDD
jgi:hypothetical protein